MVERFEESFALQVAAIGRYLQMMVDRRKHVRPGDSFIVFQDENPALEDSTHRRRARARARARRRARVLSWSALDLGVADADEGDQACDGVESEGPGHVRYTQVCFQRCNFYVDLPTPTLTPAEGEKLKARRSGFYWLREQRPAFYSLKLWRETAKDWNPLWKQYINSDIETAAEDIAYIWFGLWGYPPDWQLWYTAGAFDDGRPHDWVGRFPVKLRGQAP